MRIILRHDAALPVLTVLVILLLVLAATAVVRDLDARVIVAVLVVNFIVLLASPSYFEHYAALTAAPGALVLGIGASRALALPRRAVVSRWLGLAGVLVVLGYGVAVMAHPQGKQFPSAVFDAALPTGCITSDDPGALIQLNRLSSDLRSGCRLPVDVTGITYDTLHRTAPDGKVIGREANLAWQDWIQTYLSSGSGFVIVRPDGDRFDPQVHRDLARYPVLSAARGLLLHRGTGVS
jgi:hypothetical protein